MNATYQPLNDEQLKEIATKYFNERRNKVVPQENPTAVFIAGQPGAGKSQIAASTREQLKQQGGYIHIDADRMREELPTNNIKYPSEQTQGDAAKLVGLLREKVVSEKINFLEEGTFRDSKGIGNSINALQQKGYSVEFKAVAVSQEESLLGICQRYERQIASKSANPRILSEDYHNLAMKGFNQTVKEQENSFNRIQVVNRSSEVLYDSQSKNSEKSAYQTLVEGQKTDLDKLNTVKAGWQQVQQSALARNEKNNEYLQRISNNLERITHLQKSEIAKQNINQTTGKLVSYGVAPYPHSPTGAKSYFAEIQTANGENHKLWGKGISSALAESNARQGDMIHLAKTGNDGKQNTWKAEVLKTVAQQNIETARTSGDPTALKTAQQQASIQHTAARIQQAASIQQPEAKSQTQQTNNTVKTTPKKIRDKGLER